MSGDNNKKIIDLIQEKYDGTKPLVSIEFFPPRSEEGAKNLKKRMDKMKEIVQPLFSDITWGAGGSTSTLSMELASYMQETGHVANLHLTCTNLQDNNEIDNALNTATSKNIKNIVALRGDPQIGQTEWTATSEQFTCALDLVQYIRTKYDNDTFGISVAGYPEGHPNAIKEVTDISALTERELARSSNFDGITYTCYESDYENELKYLKQKVDAGADLIITQMFFDVNVYHTFVQDCRAIGITCPIVPGLMCINNTGGFFKMTKFCKTRIPQSLLEQMTALKDNNDNPDTVKQFGIDYGVQMCQELLKSTTGAKIEPPPVLHFYTLNLEKVVFGILEKMNLLSSSATSDESDEKIMVATGSAWARVGDTVSTIYGNGTVTELNNTTGMATITITTWTLANQQNPIAYLQKQSYKKVF